MNAQQYNKLNELLAEYSNIHAALEGAEAEIKKVQLGAAVGLLPQHAQLKVKLTELDVALRKLAEQHYDELFEQNDARTHKTPFGAVKFHKSSSIEFEDAEKVLLKIQIACERELARSKKAGEEPRFVESQLIRTQSEPNLESLQGFDDATLALFGCVRKQTDNFKVLPFAMKTDKPQKRKAEAIAA